MPGIGLEEWSLGMFACAGTFALYFARGHMPLLLTHLLANLLVLGTGTLCVLAYSRLLKSPVPFSLLVMSNMVGVIGLVLGYVFIVTVRPTVSGIARFGLVGIGRRIGPSDLAPGPTHQNLRTKTPEACIRPLRWAC